MLDREKDLIKKAEELENQSKIAESDKNYELAISLLMQAKDNYTKVGLTGQVAIIIKEIVRVKHLKGDEKTPIRSYGGDQKKIESKTQFKSNLEKLGEIKSENTQMSEANGNVILEKARNLALEDKYDDSLKAYNEAYNTFKHLEYKYECKQILWQINEIKDYQRMAGFRKSKGIPLNLKDIVALASAERRRQRIQQGLGTKPRPVEIEEYKNTLRNKSYTGRPKGSKLLGQMKLSEKRNKELKNASLSTLKEQQINFESKHNEKLKKLQMLREEKKQKDELVAKGQGLLEKGKEKLKQKEYDQAKVFYTQAIELFTQLGWHNQISILEKELRNVDMYKKEAEKKEEIARLNKLKKEQDFQTRVSKVMDEKQKYNKKQQPQTSVSPEIRSKLQKIKLVREKAEKEEKSNNFSRALARYQYILELYQSIPKESIDLSKNLSEIEQKILDLKAKS